MKKIIIAAGGTAGHINAALAMGEFLENKNNLQVLYITGDRVLDLKLFKDYNHLSFPLKPLRSKNVFKIIKNIILNILIFIKLVKVLKKQKPILVAGAGGYVCGPVLLAAKFVKCKTFILEQNAVAGLTNKILASFVDYVFTHFKKTRGIKESKKVTQVGNPTRSKIKYEESINSKLKNDLRLLIFGGSLGASKINFFVKELVEKNIFSTLNSKIEIIHQVGFKNKFTVNNIYNTIDYKQLEYIDNMDYFYNWADVIICRGGASSISELRIVQKPTLIIPYPFAVDNHQLYNALELKNEVGFQVEILEESESSHDDFQYFIDKLMGIIDNLSNNSSYCRKKIVDNSCELIFKQEGLDVWN
jgi:UDP-N-acetylglucosamine--N-acetylmuramyl-(pentapeptide) pyrophosphoryl-undecaprenol N-acetylglucosamine transferase